MTAPTTPGAPASASDAAKTFSEADLSRAHAAGIRACNWPALTQEVSLDILRNYLPAAAAHLAALAPPAVPESVRDRLQQAIDDYESEAADAYDMGERPDLWDEVVEVPISDVRAVLSALSTPSGRADTPLAGERENARLSAEVEARDKVLRDLKTWIDADLEPGTPGAGVAHIAISKALAAGQDKTGGGKPTDPTPQKDSTDG